MATAKAKDLTTSTTPTAPVTDSAADLVALNWMIVGGHFFNMLAAILAILVIKQIDRMQEEKSQHLAAAAASAGLDMSLN